MIHFPATWKKVKKMHTGVIYTPLHDNEILLKVYFWDEADLVWN